jgi:NTP pyrophosphatase (non-canonical NTP hydrolase)
VESHRESISEEIADIAIYLTELADILGIDLTTAMEAKLAKNAAKYPVEQARGSAAKYTEL